MGLQLQRVEDRLGRREPAVQPRRAENRLDRIGQRLGIPRQFRRAAIALQVRGEPQPLGGGTERRRRDEVRALDGERPFRFVGVSVTSPGLSLYSVSLVE